MKSLLFCAFTALSVAAFAAAEGTFSTSGCFAQWSGDELTIRNGRFQRIFKATKAGLRTVSFKHDAFEWISGAGRKVQSDGTVPVVTAEKAEWSSVGDRGGMRVTAVIGAITNSWLVLPSVAGVIEERTCRLSMSSFDPALAKNDRNAGITRIRLGGAASAGADAILYAPRHVKVTEFDLYDRTDYTNEMICEREWLLMMRELPVLVYANVLTLEDTATGEGLAFVRLAPLPAIRAEQYPDYVLCGAQYGPAKSPAVTPVANGWPVAEFAYAGGERGRTEALHRFQRALRAYRPGRDGILLSNTWGGGNGDSRINEAFLLKEVAAGAELGVDVIQIDDGWQKGRSQNSSDKNKGTGKKNAWGNFRQLDPMFWEPCPIRLPHGLEPIVAAAKAKGMRFGLWYGPDSTDNAKHWKDDADCLLSFFRKHGIQYFKIDSMKTMSQEAFANQRKFFDRMLDLSDGAMTFDLDVTCGDRPGYFGLPHIGPIFVENRYTQHGGYWPHQTLRTLWSLSKVMDPVRMRIEFLDPNQYLDRYSKDDPLRPERYRGDTLFAISMCASPLGWMELSELRPETVAEMKPLIARWKLEREHIHGGFTMPIGSRPDGYSWTGFFTEAKTGGGYLLLFRGLNSSPRYDVELKKILPKAKSADVIGGRGTAALDHGDVVATVPEKLDFLWIKIGE
ncbi:MAG: alpha-galactosidase [Kiritimatiellae bacterium]|nr:alpha-galactosidase [Kiritimatiellia bacterium]